MNETDQSGRASLRRLHDAVSHLQAGGLAIATALSCAMLVPLPWGRILAVGFLITGLVFYAVVPRHL